MNTIHFEIFRYPFGLYSVDFSVQLHPLRAAVSRVLGTKYLDFEWFVLKMGLQS